MTFCQNCHTISFYKDDIRITEHYVTMCTLKGSDSDIWEYADVLEDVHIFFLTFWSLRSREDRILAIIFVLMIQSLAKSASTLNTVEVSGQPQYQEAYDNSSPIIASLLGWVEGRIRRWGHISSVSRALDSACPQDIDLPAPYLAFLSVSSTC
jgi:hypothetical protein